MRTFALTLIASFAIVTNAWCNGKDNGCRHIALGDGDCDRDSDCAGSEKCGSNNCYRGPGTKFDSTDDCCYNPHYMSKTQRFKRSPDSRDTTEKSIWANAY